MTMHIIQAIHSYDVSKAGNNLTRPKDVKKTVLLLNRHCGNG